MCIRDSYIQHSDDVSFFYNRYYYLRLGIGTAGYVTGKLLYIRNNQRPRFLPCRAANSSAETNACTGDGTLKRCQYEFVAFHHIKADPEKVEGLLQGGGNICQIGDTIRFRAYQCL